MNLSIILIDIFRSHGKNILALLKCSNNEPVHCSFEKFTFAFNNFRRLALKLHY